MLFIRQRWVMYNRLQHAHKRRLLTPFSKEPQNTAILETLHFIPNSVQCLYI